MAWFYLFLGGLCEVGFATCMKYSENFSKLYPTIGFILLATISYLFLYLGMRTLPMGTAYSVWTGMGALGTVIVGLVVFREPANFARMFFLFLLIASIVGLKITSK